MLRKPFVLLAADTRRRYSGDAVGVATASWQKALQAALGQRPAQPPPQAETAATVLNAVDAVLTGLLPQDVAEPVTATNLATLRRCRWALTAAADPSIKADVCLRYLTAYVTTAQRQSFQLSRSSASAAPAPLTTSSLEEGSRLCLLEAVETFSEARVLKLPGIGAAHYSIFISCPLLVELDDLLVRDLLLEYEAQRASSASAKHKSLEELDDPDEALDLRLTASASYASAGMPSRALSLVTGCTQHLTEVVERVVSAHRYGWRQALDLASHLGGVVHNEPDAGAPPMSSVHQRYDAVAARCTAADWANRSAASPHFFSTLLPEVAALLSEARRSAHSPQSELFRLQRPICTRVVERMMRLAHPEHWEEALLLYQQERDIALKGEQNAAGAATADASRPGGDGSSPLGRVMHVLLLANRWSECLAVYDRATTAERRRHTSAFNHMLCATGHRVRHMLEKNESSSAQALQALRTMYLDEVASGNVNLHTNVAFLRSVFTFAPAAPRGIFSGECASAVANVAAHRHAVRLLESAALHCALGGCWAQAVLMVSHKKGVSRTAQASRYALVTAVAASAQQGQLSQAVTVAESLMAQPLVSKKQVALCTAVLVACCTSSTSLPTRYTTSAVSALRGVLASSRHHHGPPPIAAQSDFDSFTKDFLSYLCSAIQRRRVACDARGSFEELVETPHRCDVADATATLAHIMRVLELPPRDAGDRHQLQTTFGSQDCYKSGSVKVNWAAALHFLSAAAQDGQWSTAAVPSLLMECGYHQDLVVACF